METPNIKAKQLTQKRNKEEKKKCVNVCAFNVKIEFKIR